MEARDVKYLSVLKMSYATKGNHVDFPKLTEDSIEALIEEFNDQEVGISRDKSEKRVKIDVRNGTNTAKEELVWVPLEANLGRKNEVVEYNLIPTNTMSSINYLIREHPSLDQEEGPYVKVGGILCDVFYKDSNFSDTMRKGLFMAGVERALNKIFGDKEED